MKTYGNLLLTFGLLFTLSLNISAQTETKNKLFLEAQSGVNFSNVLWIGGNLGDFNPGLNGGLFLGYNLSDHFFVESGLGYTSKGFLANITITTLNMEEVRFKEDFHYVTIPLRVGFKFGNRVQFFAKQSLNLDYLVQTQTHIAHPSEFYDGYDYNRIQYMRRIDISTTHSIGLNIPIGHYYFGSTINQNISLTSFSKLFNGTRNHLFGLHVQVGYNF